MQVEIQINNSPAPNSRFVTWSAAPCRVRMTDSTGVTGATVTVDLSGTSKAGAGQVGFSKAATGTFAKSLAVTLPTSGASVSFFVAGTFGKPSSNAGDVTVFAKDAGSTVGSVDLMVRIRKDANTLSIGERDRFLAALGTLNNKGTGRFVDFRDMHDGSGDEEMHGHPGFLPWHRAYLLDLERELQAIDSSVSLPYWRFDKAAAKVFQSDFMGVPDASGSVQFDAGHSLEFWTTEGVLGIDREALFDTATKKAVFVQSDADTLALGTTFAAFQDMEVDPHGHAHVSFSQPFSFISVANFAPRDPLFFLLHCNVDRLWAKWQQANKRYDPSKAGTYFTAPGMNRIGHNLDDTMWPWNGVTTGLRPPTAPGGFIAGSPILTAPSDSPIVRDMFDYRGVVAPSNQLGFDYDDVPV